MARISTGQTLGETGRATAARLLGGIEQTGTPGLLAQAAINAPGLQPQAAPVETFQQVGAPTIGGPPKIFAPPDLPAPNQDLANLAKSLGSFNAALQEFGEAAIKQQKALSESRQQEAQQFVAQSSQFGTFGTKAELHKNLEKAAGAGNKDAQRLLQYMLSRHPGMMTYVDDAIGESGIVNRITLLPEVMKNARNIPDLKGGEVDIRTLRSSDAAYQAYLNQNLLGGLSLNARAYTKYQAAIVNAQAQEYKRQDDAYYTRQRQDNDTADTIRFDSMAKAAAYGKVTPEEVGAMLTGMGQKRYLIDEDAGKKWKDNLGANLRVALLALPEETEDEIAQKTLAMETVYQGLGYALWGPVEQRYDEKGRTRDSAYLVNTLGGLGWWKQWRSEILAAQNQLAAVQQTADRNSGDDYGQKLSGQLFTPEVIKNPAALDRTFQQGMQQLESVYRNKPIDQKNAAISAFTAQYSNYKTGFSEPIRQQREAQLRLALISAADQGPAALQRVETQIQAAVAADPSFVTRAAPLLSQIEARRDKANAPLIAEADGLRRAKLKEWDNYSKQSDSWPGTVDTGQKESQMRASANRRMQERFQQIITEGKKRGLSNDEISAQLQKEAANSNFGLQRKFVAPAERAAYRSLKEANQGIGWAEWVGGGIYNPNDKRNQELKKAIISRPVTTQEELERQLDGLLEGKPMDPELKAVLKRTGLNISDYFMYQMRQQQEQRNGRVRSLWDGVDEPTRQRLRDLDGRRSQLLSQGGDNQPTTQNIALAPVQPFRQAVRQLADVALNVVSSPAQAATPIATMSPAISTWTPSKPLRAATGRGTVNGYLKRLAYLETRIRNIPNAEGSDGQGYFQAFGPFNQEATQASGIPMGARNPNYELAARATWAWIQRFNPKAAQAVIRGEYSKADRLLRNTWPSLPGGSQAQSLKVQREALRYLNL